MTDFKFTLYDFFGYRENSIWLESFLRATNRELSYAEATFGLTEDKRTTIHNPKLSPGVVFSSPRKQKGSARASAFGPTSCIVSSYLPPYYGGSPPSLIHNTNAPLNVQGYAEGIHQTGNIELLSSVFRGDPTADDTRGIFYRLKSAFIIVASYFTPESAGRSKVTVSATIRAKGSTFITILDGPEPTGFAYVGLRLHLTAQNLRTLEEVRATSAPISRYVGPPPSLTYELGIKGFDETIPLTTSVLSEPGDRVLTTVDASLIVGVNNYSNLFIDGNFSSYTNLFQGAGFINIAGVQISYC